MKSQILAKKLIEQPFYDLVEKVEQVKNAMKFLEKSSLSPRDIDTFFRFRLIMDERLFSRIQVKFPENLPRILKKLSDEFKIETVLEPFISGAQSLGEIINGSDLLFRASDLFDLVDFVNRRNLLI